MEVTSEFLVPSLEGLTPTEIRSVIYPYFLQFAISVPRPEHARDIVVLVNPTNNLISFHEGRPMNAEPTLEGFLPASKASIEAMPVVKVLDEGIDCSICLLDLEIDEEAKEMPCKHRFHSICIDKWLGINGSCPICRYKMPVDKQCEGKNDESSEDERGDDGGNDREEDRVMFVFHVLLRRGTVPRHADDVLIGVRDGGVSEARDGNESETGDGGDDYESDAQDMDDDLSEPRDGDESNTRVGGDGHESKSQHMVIDNHQFAVGRRGGGDEGEDDVLEGEEDTINIYREANLVADGLANLTFSQRSCFQWYSHVPSKISPHS